VIEARAMQANAAPHAGKMSRAGSKIKTPTRRHHETY